MTITAGGDAFADLAGLAQSEPWMDEALCAEIDPELWFPERGEPNKLAKAICRRCETRAKCLDYALSQDENPFGVWGGTSEQERRKLRRRAAA